MQITLAQALKAKNRLIQQLNHEKAILKRENSRLEGVQPSKSLEEVYGYIIALTEKLVNLKALIASANVDIYHDIEEMRELKSLISYIQSLDKTSGQKVVSYSNPPVYQMYTAFMTQTKGDESILDIIKQIEALQDKIDTFNATHFIEWHS